MNFAKGLGADYADIRIQKTRSEVICLRNLSLKNIMLITIHSICGIKTGSI